MAALTNKNNQTSSRKIWLWTAIVISVLVLIISLSGLIGTWIIRGVAIDLNNGIMDGVTRIAESGEQTVVRVQERVGEVVATAIEVENAADSVALNVADRGLILTVLPPEREQNLINSVTQIRQTVRAVLDSVNAAVDLYASINAIPFVDLPRPSQDRLQELETSMQEIENSTQQLSEDVQEFRDNASAEVGKISAAAGDVKIRLQNTESNLDQLHADLEQLQTSAQNFKVTFATIATIAAVILTLVILWVIYGMLVIIQKSRADLSR